MTTNERFPLPLVMEDAGDGDHFILHAPLEYWMRDETILTVPTGFVTDLASIPYPFRMVLPKRGKYDHAAVCHDYAFRTDSVPVFTLGAANQLMKDAMADSPHPPNRVVRWIINAGLAIGSAHVFHEHPVAWIPKELR